MKITSCFLLVLCIGFFVVATSDLEAQTIEDRVQDLERQVDRLATTGLVLFLFGVFCAFWAQETGRGAWGWFFLGLFFGPITAIVLLSKNAKAKGKTDSKTRGG